MPVTLTQAAIWTKRSLITLGITFLLIILGWIGYSIWYSYYIASLPPVEELPENKFGILPAIAFPASAATSSNFSYSIDTETGNLPNTPKMVKVYFIPQAGISLLGPDKAAALAQKSGFLDGPEILSTYLYRFINTTGGELVIDLNSSNFYFRKPNYAPEATSSASSQTPTTYNTPEDLVGAVKTFLKSLDFMPTQLEQGRSHVITSNPNIKEAKSAEVSLWPAAIDDMEIITAKPNRGLVRANLDLTKPGNNIFTTLEYKYWPVDLTTSSTYFIKNAAQAYEDLQKGKGFIGLEPKGVSVSITDIYIAYYQSAEYSQYLQPVYVFQGTNFSIVRQ